MCFSLAWLEQLLIWLVVIGALIACIRILVPWAAGLFGGLGPVEHHRDRDHRDFRDLSDLRVVAVLAWGARVPLG